MATLPTVQQVSLGNIAAPTQSMAQAASLFDRALGGFQKIADDKIAEQTQKAVGDYKQQLQGVTDPAEIAALTANLRNAENTYGSVNLKTLNQEADQAYTDRLAQLTSIADINQKNRVIAADPALSSTYADTVDLAAAQAGNKLINYDATGQYTEANLGQTALDESTLQQQLARAAVTPQAVQDQVNAQNLSFKNLLSKEQLGEHQFGVKLQDDVKKAQMAEAANTANALKFGSEVELGKQQEYANPENLARLQHGITQQSLIDNLKKGQELGMTTAQVNANTPNIVPIAEAEAEAAKLTAQLNKTMLEGQTIVQPTVNETLLNKAKTENSAATLALTAQLAKTAEGTPAYAALKAKLDAQIAQQALQVSAYETKAKYNAAVVEDAKTDLSTASTKYVDETVKDVVTNLSELAPEAYNNLSPLGKGILQQPENIQTLLSTVSSTNNPVQTMQAVKETLISMLGDNFTSQDPATQSKVINSLTEVFNEVKNGYTQQTNQQIDNAVKAGVPRRIARDVVKFNTMTQGQKAQAEVDAINATEALKQQVQSAPITPEQTLELFDKYAKSLSLSTESIAELQPVLRKMMQIKGVTGNQMLVALSSSVHDGVFVDATTIGWSSDSVVQDRVEDVLRIEAINAALKHSPNFRPTWTNTTNAKTKDPNNYNTWGKADLQKELKRLSDKTK